MSAGPTRSALMTGRYTYRLGTQAEIVESYVPFGIPLRERSNSVDMTRRRSGSFSHTPSMYAAGGADADEVKIAIL